jgi:hypothetical protein
VIRVGQRDLLTRRFVYLLLDLFQPGKARHHRSDLIRQPRDFLLCTRAFLEVGRIESFEISADALGDLFH